MNTHDYYVSLETAKMLEKAGFDWECCLYFSELENAPDDAGIVDKETKKVYGVFNSDIFGKPSKEYIWRPTVDVAQRWLREVKGIHITVKADAASINCKYFVTVIISDTKWGNVQDENKKTILFNTYEEAQEAGIKKALELILEKGE